MISRTSATHIFLLPVLLLISTIALLPRSAQAACTSPAGVAGSVQWFTTNSRHLYCDGTNWRDFSGDYWRWNSADLTEIFYSSEVGINTTTPILPVDVAGSVRVGYTSQACNAGLAGTLRYYTAQKTYQYCDGTSWKGFASGVIPPDPCQIVTFTSPGFYYYKALAGCTTLLIEVWGGGGGAGIGSFSGSHGGGGGGASYVDNAVPATLVRAGGGGGGGGDTGASIGGAGGGGGYARLTTTLTAGDVLKIAVGEGGQSACGATGGEGGEISGGKGGVGAAGGDSTNGGGGGGDNGFRGGSSTNGGGGGGGNAVNNNLSTTSYGGAGGADKDNSCGATTSGGSCGGWGEGGGGGGGIGDISLLGLSGDRYGGGTSPQGGSGAGAFNTTCPSRGGNGRVKITPSAFITPADCGAVTLSTPGYYLYQVPASCNTLIIDAYGAGGGGGVTGGFGGGHGGGGGGSSRVEDDSSTILALAGGGGGGSISTGFPVTASGGGGGGYARKTTGALTAGDYLLVVVGEGGESGCNAEGGEGGEPGPGLGGVTRRGGDSVNGGGGGGDDAQRGGSSTNGGGGGGGNNVNNNLSTTSYGGAGGADIDNTCGTSTFGGACSATKGGGGGGGIGDTVTIGTAGTSGGGGAAANGGPGTGANQSTSCPTRGGNGRVVIQPDICPGAAIGDTCPDGSVYAGTLNSVKLFIPPADNSSSTAWNNGSTNYTTTGVTSQTDGKGNTQTLVALSDAGAPYAAATLCDGLTAHGHSDWYLPSRDELNVLYTNAAALGGFANVYYWGSTESGSANSAFIENLSTGYIAAGTKNTAFYIRCMRK
ncbi:MAG: Lcl C-terminal domain-containing protein [Micavibrio sp.]